LLLNGLLDETGLADKAVAVLRALDKLGKQGRDVVLAEMTGPGAGLSAQQATKVLFLAEIRGDNRDLLDLVADEFQSSPRVSDGVARLRELVAVAEALEIPGERLRIDLGICRGLDYYTGTVYETFLTDLPRIGSVCSGGRYDDLAGLYSKQKLPGVGASLGLDRLLAAMEELKLLPKTGTPAQVLVVQFAADHLTHYQKIARDLRAAGISVEVYPDAKKIGPQLQYAESRGFKLALIAGPDEVTRHVVKLKDLAKREEVTVGQAELAAKVRDLLGGP
jgi:histidyl-tRNA synthetase